jgi:hypothetical protein
LSYLAPREKGAIWVVVDRLSKLAHFIPIRTTNIASQPALIYISEIIRIHGVPKTIIYDRDVKFTSKFWESLHNPWVLRSVLAQLSILGRMASSSVPFKFSKTCSTYVPCHGKVIVKVTCPLWSVTSQFLGKEFINFSHKIMHHFMHTITMHLHTSSNFCFVLESKTFSVCFKYQKESFINFKVWHKFKSEVFATFQTKFKAKLKRKEKEKGK